jgi:hypothetical protein
MEISASVFAPLRRYDMPNAKSKAAVTRKPRGKKPYKPPTLDEFVDKKLRAACQKWPPFYNTKKLAKVFVNVVHIEGDLFQVTPDDGSTPFIIEDEKLKSGARVMYRCNYCGLLWFDKYWFKTTTGKWRKSSAVAIDHIDPAVPVTGWVSWDSYIDRLFNSPTQILCKNCHCLKTTIENTERAYVRRINKSKLESEET